MIELLKSKSDSLERQYKLL